MSKVQTGGPNWEMKFCQGCVAKYGECVDETKKDKVLQELLGFIRDGWPDTKQQCPLSVRDYWNVRSELSEAEGLILKGSKIVVPTTMRKLMLNKIHEGHLGIEKCKRRARQVLYWPRINQDISDMVQNCHSCLMYKPKQQKETLKPHAVPNSPWKKLIISMERQVSIRDCSCKK